MSRDAMYVCAEIGVNWDGDFKQLEDEILDLRRAGVDAVKIQMFDEMNIKDYEPTLRGQLSKMILNTNDILDIAEWVHEGKMELVVTPMYPDAFEILRGLPIDGIKIRAKDWDNKEFYDASRRLDLPVYTSVPQPLPKLDDPTTFMRTRGKDRYRVYCIPKYPPAKSDLNLYAVIDYDGVSLHSSDWYDHFAAACINIQYQYYNNLKRRFYIEVHYLNDNLPREQQPDANVSVDWHGMTKLVRACADLEETIG